MTHPPDSLLARPLARRRQNHWLRRALLFATIVVIVDALVGESGLAATMRARRAYVEAETRLVELRSENAVLREQSRRLTEDPRAIEAVAREELGLIRPGEVLVTVRAVR